MCVLFAPGSRCICDDGHIQETQGPSTSQIVRFANDLASLGMTARSKSPKLPFGRNLVKPPKPSASSQPADCARNINSKIWRVYPLQFAILKIETKSTNKQARAGIPARAFLSESKLKKATKQSSKPRPQVAPLVRGRLNNKAKGAIGELAFARKAAALGFGVAKPHADNERYDFILDSGERFWRVQVKTIWQAHGHLYQTSVSHGHGLNKKPYGAREIDFVVAYLVPLDIWYVIPVRCVAGSTSLTFYPFGCRQGGGHFEPYREAWYLMAPGGDASPHPGILPRVHAMACESGWDILESAILPISCRGVPLKITVAESTAPL